jgi:uncharacterized cupin superfamily protein
MSTDATPIAHWDDVEPRTQAVGHISGSWAALSDAAGSVGIGMNRVQVDPGRWSTPAHVHGGSEEIFVVLGGSGISWQDGSAYEVGEGDVIVHHARGPAHSLLAGDDGLDVLVYGPRLRDSAAHLPRAGVWRIGARWVSSGGDHPWRLEAAVGPPEVPEPAARPSTIVRLSTVTPQVRRGATVSRTVRDAGRAAGSRTTGLRLNEVDPGKLGTPPHCHSAEEELFVVLQGSGELLLGDARHPVRRGHVVARPPGTGIAHAFQAGPDGLTFLAYGTREPDDMCFYPRSGKIIFRGLGVVGRVEQVEFWDGED